MKKRETYPGKAYAVTTQSGCSVYADEAGAQLIKTIEAGQGYFVAIGSQTWFDDNSAIITETFNVAPMAASGGGGASIEVDQVFTTTSENAQSGKAVAGAFNNVYYVKNAGSAVCLGQNSNVAGPGRYAIAIGGYTSTGNYSSPLAVGAISSCNGDGGISIGSNTQSSGAFAAAIGSLTKNKDKFTTVIGCYNDTDKTLTQLYLMCAGSPLANTYEGGSACLGYVVKESSGNIIECGTRKLSELFTNNTAFAPAAFGLDDEPTPGPFLPTGIMEPIELDEFPNQ